MNLSKILIGFGLFLVASSLVVTVNGKQEKTSALLLTPKNTVNIRTGVTDESMLLAQQQLAELDLIRGKKDYPIYIVLNTPGGSVYAGENFIQFAKNYKNVKTITIFAASMGAVIVESLPGQRLITNNGILMFHRARGQFEGQFAEGELESRLRLWTAIVNSMSERVAARMKMSLQEYKDKIVNELWIYGNEAIVQNAADEVVDIKCSQELINTKEEQVEMVLGFIPVTFIYSGCPLMMNPIDMKPEEESTKEGV